MLGFKAPSLENFKDPKKMQGLLGDPIFMTAMGVLSNRKNRFGGAIQGLNASSEYASQKEEEERQKKLYDLQMKTGEFNYEQAQEKKGKDIVAQTVIGHFNENPFAPAFGGPNATPQQQLAGLISRGVDPQTASELVGARLKQMQLEKENTYDPYASAFVGQQNGEQGVWAFDHRTKTFTRVPGSEGFIQNSLDPAVEHQRELWKTVGQQDAKFQEILRQDLPNLQSYVGQMRSVMDNILADKTNTGVIKGYFGRVFDPETAELNALAVLGTIRELKNSGLAPVSNADFAKMEEIFASSLKGDAVNVKLLNWAIKRAESAMKTIADQQKYYIQNGTLHGWVPESMRGELGSPQRPGGYVVPGSSPAQQRQYQILGPAR